MPYNAPILMSQVNQEVDMNRSIFVIAGNRQQYDVWIRQHIKREYQQNPHCTLSLSNYVYVGGPETFRGYKEVHGYFVGSYRERNDIRDIVREIRRINGIHPSQMIIPDMYIGRGVSVI